jgi:hypothetical protein
MTYTEERGKVYELVLRNVATKKDWVLDYLNPVAQGLEDIHIRFNPFDPSGQQMVLTAFTGDARVTVLITVDIKHMTGTQTGITGKFVFAQFDRTGKKLIGIYDGGIFLADLSERGGPKATKLTLEWEMNLAHRLDVKVPRPYPVAVCPAEEVACFFGAELAPADRPRPVLILSDLAGKTVALLRVHEKNSSLDDIAPVWTPDGRYVCYYDLQQEGDATVNGTRIFDRITLKEKAFVKGAAAMGPGSGGSIIVLASFAKGDAHGILYEVETGNSSDITPAGTRLLHAAGGKAVYLEPNARGQMAMYCADFGWAVEHKRDHPTPGTP